MYSNINEMLPIELKERIFSHYTSKITPNSNSASFPIATYPEDRYRDVQLVNRITCQRVIPLCFAMWSSLDYRFEKVKRLIEEEACDVNESDLEGFCPLHYAAIYGRIEACKLLLSHGADCTRKNNFGKTPADLAQDARVQQMIKCMLFFSILLKLILLIHIYFHISKVFIHIYSHYFFLMNLIHLISHTISSRVVTCPFFHLQQTSPLILFRS